MASRRASITKGFTLIEVLIVIGLLAIIGGFSAVATLDNYRMSAFRDERKTLVTALQKARAEALNNIDQKAHGVAVLPSDHPSDYVIFEGDDYATADHDKDQLIPSSYSVELEAGSVQEVKFAQLSAVASCDGVVCDGVAGITLHDPVRDTSVAVTVNREGRVDWNNL